MTSSPQERKANDAFKEIFTKRPHVVILGAGATVDSFPKGDKFGKPSPLMNDMIDVLDLRPILSTVKLKTESTNIENIYTELFERGKECKDVLLEIESSIRDYFNLMKIPDEVTKYDLLLISLTNKDCVASFNWDPLLIQAYNRVNQITDNLPEIVFLHGNVGAGICEKCKQYGPIVNSCPVCKMKFNPVPLLYPVKNKDYNKSIFIRHSWNSLKYYLSKAALVTIYGYSAPATDIEASKILIKAYSKYEGSHILDRIEIIERKGFKDNELSQTLQDLKSSARWHYELLDDFFKSKLAEAPRRSVECYYKQDIEGWWGSPKLSLSKGLTFKTLKLLLQPLLDNEIHNDFKVI